MSDTRTQQSVQRTKACHWQSLVRRCYSPSRLTFRVLALSMVVLLTACSSIQLGYNNADMLLVSSIDDYFDLKDEQKTLARERVRELLIWHRATQLKQYAKLLDDTRHKFYSQVTSDEVLSVHEEIQQNLANLGEQAAPALARLALTLRSSQIDYFGAKLARDGAKARIELARNARRKDLDERAESYAEYAQTWFGSLNDAQLAIMRNSLAELTSGREWWMDERERRQHDLLMVLRRIHDERPPVTVAADWLRNYFAQLRLPAEADRRARVVSFRRSNAALIAQLINSAGPKQKAELTRKLQAYSKDFWTLATNES